MQRTGTAGDCRTRSTLRFPRGQVRREPPPPHVRHRPDRMIQTKKPTRATRKDHRHRDMGDQREVGVGTGTGEG